MNGGLCWLIFFVAVPVAVTCNHGVVCALRCCSHFAIKQKQTETLQCAEALSVALASKAVSQVTFNVNEVTKFLK